MWFLCSLKCDVSCLKISLLALCFFWETVCVCVSMWDMTRLNYPLLLYSLLILIISGDLHWKAYRCRTRCFPQRLSIIDTVLKSSPETNIFSASWCFLINYYKVLSSNVWVHPKFYPVRLECSIFRNALPALTKLSANHISDGLIWLKWIINRLISLDFGCTNFYVCACALNVLNTSLFEVSYCCSTFSPG